MSWLPSESQLIAQRGVSRRTVRDAIAELRAQGLIAVVDGKGAYVRPATELVRHTHSDRDPHRLDLRRYRHRGLDRDREAHDLPRGRLRRDRATAGVPTRSTLFGCDRLLADPTGQQRMLHRLYLPWQTADDIPALEEDPFRTPDELYALLGEAGHKLPGPNRHRPHARPRRPTTLHIPEGTSMLTTRRTTTDADGRVLALEETRLSARETQLAYAIAPTRAGRSVR